MVYVLFYTILLIAIAIKKLFNYFIENFMFVIIFFYKIIKWILKSVKFKLLYTITCF